MSVKVLNPPRVIGVLLQRRMDDDIVSRRNAQQLSWFRRTVGVGGSATGLPDTSVWSQSLSTDSGNSDGIISGIEGLHNVGGISGSVSGISRPSGVSGISAICGRSTHGSALGWSQSQTPSQSHFQQQQQKQLHPPNPKTPPCLYSILPGFEAAKFEVMFVPNCGDCLFDSIRIILQSIGLDYTLKHLRSVVAYPVLDVHDKETNATIDTWLALYKQACKEKNKKLHEEYKFISSLENAKIPLSKKHREELYKAMMLPDYWGDDHAIRILEERLNVRFLTLHDNGVGQFPLDHSKESRFNPEHIALLFQTQNCYMPLSYNSQYVFRRDTVPETIRRLFTCELI